MAKYITCYDLDEDGNPILHKPFFMKFSDEAWQKITLKLEKLNKENNVVEKVTETVEKGDKEWEPVKEDALLEKLRVNNFSRLRKRIDADKKQFPSFWVIEQKYDQYYYTYNSIDDVEKMKEIHTTTFNRKEENNV